LARLATGRSKIVVFEGSYHGHIDDTLHGTPHERALEVKQGTIVVPYNDLEALEAVLRGGEIACVLAEPALTNINTVLPQPGFHEALRVLTREHGALLVLDETHTHVCAWGGLTRVWHLSPDVLVVGKAIAGGVPMGIYGMTAELANLMERELEIDQWPAGASGRLAVGGTLYGNPLSMAASRAVLEEILTPEGHRRTARLGAQLADGIDHAARVAGLPWTAHRLFCRTGVCYAPELPRNAEEAARAADYALNRLHRVFLANRGIWEAVMTAGPSVSFAADESDIDAYVGVFEELVAALLQTSAPGS
jgi:glutamate-1-semialdehyde aminotransferase